MNLKPKEANIVQYYFVEPKTEGNMEILWSILVISIFSLPMSWLAYYLVKQYYLSSSIVWLILGIISSIVSLFTFMKLSIFNIRTFKYRNHKNLFTICDEGVNLHENLFLWGDIILTYDEVELITKFHKFNNGKSYLNFKQFIMTNFNNFRYLKLKTKTGKSINLPIFILRYSDTEDNDNSRFFHLLKILKAGVSGELDNIRFEYIQNTNLNEQNLPNEISMKQILFGFFKVVQVIFSIVNFILGYAFMRIENNMSATLIFSLAGLLSFPWSISYLKENLGFVKKLESNLFTALCLTLAVGFYIIGSQSLSDISENSNKSDSLKKSINSKPDTLSNEPVNTLFELIKHKQDSIDKTSSTITKP